MGSQHDPRRFFDRGVGRDGDDVLGHDLMSAHEIAPLISFFTRVGDPAAVTLMCLNCCGGSHSKVFKKAMKSPTWSASKLNWGMVGCPVTIPSASASCSVSTG